MYVILSHSLYLVAYFSGFLFFIFSACVASKHHRPIPIRLCNWTCFVRMYHNCTDNGLSYLKHRPNILSDSLKHQCDVIRSLEVNQVCLLLTITCYCRIKSNFSSYSLPYNYFSKVTKLNFLLHWPNCQI